MRLPVLICLCALALPTGAAEKTPAAGAPQAGAAATTSAAAGGATAGALAQAPSAAIATATPQYRTSMYEITETTGPVVMDEGTYAVFHTSDGEFIARLYEKQAPTATKNFIDLASGRKSWKHPITLVDMTTPLYNNTTIYRIIRDALLYGGDPVNRGAGDPGYTLPPEKSPELTFNAPGMLAMDRSGEQSSGCRWIIMLRPFPDWTGRYTIIGKIVGGLEVARDISRKPTRKPTMPLDPTLVNSIEIVSIPKGQQTVANFSVEDGRKVVTIDKNFKPAAAPTPIAAVAAVTTSAGTPATTAAKAAATKANDGASTGARRNRNNQNSGGGRNRNRQ